jgi:ABC-type nitrate/sulfonate/bicarbonate transport system permease component
MKKSVERAMPFFFGIIGLCLWQAAIWISQVPSYVLPGPIAIIGAYASDYGTLNAALLSTLTVTFTALLAATVLGVVLALAMAASDLARAAIQPWAVILQVTPVVAIAPLIIIWVNQPFLALVVCATIVAFFPVLSNTAAGLAATPHDLLDLFRLNGAADCRHTGAGGCGGGGIRRRVRRVCFGAGVPDSGSRIPAGNSAHVRRFGAAWACGDCDLCWAWPVFLFNATAA